MAQQHLNRPRAIPSDFVELEHPDVDGTYKAAPGAVAHWEERGWKRVSDKSKSSKKADNAGSES